MPDYANPQSLNRYSYVINNPLRYTDPTGHIMSEGDGGGCGKKCKSYIEQQKKKKDDEKSPTFGDGLIGPPNVPQLPGVQILHPLDSGVISQVQIYDYSYYPKKPMGHMMTFYRKDGNVEFDPYALLNMAAGEVASAAIKRFVIEGMKKQLEGLGMSLAGCPECTMLYEGYQAIENIAAINNAFTIESHLRTETVYYPPPNPFVPRFPDEYLYRKIE